MRTPGIVPLDPLPDRRFCLCEAMKAMLPNALLFQTAEESLDNPVLLGGIGGLELLGQPVVATSRPKPPALEDQPVVAAHHRGFAGGPQSSKASDAGLLDGSFGLLRSTPQSELLAHQFPIVTVDHPNQVGPKMPYELALRMKKPWRSVTLLPSHGCR